MIRKAISIFSFNFLLFAGADAQSIDRWKASDFLNYIDTASAPLVINFWATYCAPCIEELPYFHSITEEFSSQGVRLLLVSLDFENMYPDRIRSVANSRGFTAPIVWLDEEKPDVFCPQIDKNWSGSMPATLFYYRKNGYRKFIEAQIKPERLYEAIQTMLQ